MYAQFFGGYLLSKGAVSPEQLTSAISKLSDTHIKLGTLAMHKGYMTASEVDEVCFLQTRDSKIVRFVTSLSKPLMEFPRRKQ